MKSRKVPFSGISSFTIIPKRVLAFERKSLLKIPNIADWFKSWIQSAISGILSLTSIELKISKSSFHSDFIGDWYSVQASFFCFFTVSIDSLSITSNSLAVAMLLSIIHSWNFFIQSKSCSHCSLSLLLYRSWEPEVEWPVGCVISTTWIIEGMCFSLANFSAFSYAETKEG